MLITGVQTLRAVRPPRAIVISDVDGTLRAHGETIGQDVPAFLRKMVESDVDFVPCSGKSVAYLQRLFDSLAVWYSMVGGENGGHIAYFNGNIWADRYFADATALEAAREHLKRCHGCNSWRKIEPKRTIFTARFGTFERARRRAQTWREHMAQELGGVDVAVYTYPPNDDAVDLVINPSDISKANAVRFVQECHPGVPIVVAGDGLNDLPMISAKGVIPVCPSNAAEEVKAIVREHEHGYIAGDPYGAGAMEVIDMALWSLGITS